MTDLCLQAHYINNHDESVEIIELTPEKVLSRMAKSRPYYSTERREKASRFKQIIDFFQSSIITTEKFVGSS